MRYVRRIKEVIYQGKDESVAYTLDVTPWGDTPTALAVVLYEINPVTGVKTDVSVAKLTGAPVAVGNDITTPRVAALDVGAEYRLEIKFVISGNTFEAWAETYGEE